MVDSAKHIATVEGSAKATLEFDASSGTPVINQSYGIASITDRGPGKFTIILSRPMSSTNFPVFGCTFDDSFGDSPNANVVASPISTTSVTYATGKPTTGVNEDFATNSFVAFGDLA